MSENKCVECAAAERRALANAPATVATNPRKDQTIARANLPRADARRHIRVLTPITGQIEDQNGPRGFNVLEISKSGAKLQTAHGLPNGTLTLAFPGGATLHANPAWQDGVTGGVTFIEPPNEVIGVIGKVMPALEPMLCAA